MCLKTEPLARSPIKELTILNHEKKFCRHFLKTMIMWVDTLLLISIHVYIILSTLRNSQKPNTEDIVPLTPLIATPPLRKQASSKNKQESSFAAIK